ncbi:hypothetical protein CH373_13870 [Leptospira perolatii]|uniref:Disease resistance R13L4/SHOC-2-like LRR domain-containing protein n=1 Tax=Leptospira perolatii TaxID=2023191 RepID=A0A2M9ZKK0_9LEPT|nr:hypothetical protein [Leptospira perolatii]PJZ69359.1 hypothetical protein CH360_11435 [Leptospira perolatii]PJZ72494.1 hypothetical protein CH373_13870 [Leptospira perolatii]
MKILRYTLILSILASGSFCKKSAEEILSEAEKNPQNIERLDLGMKKLGKIPDSLHRFKNLKWLDVRMNGLNSLPESIDSWSQLEYLNIYGNEITSLPDNIKNLKNLKVFFGGNNKFPAIPETLKELPQLEALYLDQNKISLTESDIENVLGMQKLEILDLSRNFDLKSFPKNIDQLADHPRLRLLILKGSGLKGSEVKKAKDSLSKIRIEF